MFDQWKITPPVAVIVAGFMGYKPPEDAPPPPKQLENKIKPEQFVDFLRGLAPSGNMRVN
jgi:hypothetical protein